MKKVIVLGLLMIMPSIAQAMRYELVVHDRCDGRLMTAVYKYKTWVAAKRARAVFQKDARFERVYIRVIK